MGIVDHIRLLRPQQWYKNLLVFIALFFTGGLFDPVQLWLCIAGFIALCMVSSSYYIINDIIDSGEDRRHPEKRSRPVASGKVRIPTALSISSLLLIASVILAYQLGTYFALLVLSLFLLTMLYTLLLKKEPFADLILIGVNFVLRAVSGALIIKVSISPWLIVGAFFFALFLASGKRKADLALSPHGKISSHKADNIAAEKQDKPQKKMFGHKIVYTQDMLGNIVIANMVMAIFCYALYSFQRAELDLIYSLPFFIFFMMRYYGHIYNDTDVARQPNKAIYDIRLMAAGVMLAIIVFAVFYLY